MKDEVNRTEGPPSRRLLRPGGLLVKFHSRLKMLKVQWVKRAICLKSGFVAITRFQTFVHQFLPKVEIFPSQLIIVKYDFL